MNGPQTSQVQVFMEILHRPTDLGEGVFCLECPEQPWPCRTINLLQVGLRMDGTQDLPMIKPTRTD